MQGGGVMKRLCSFLFLVILAVAVSAQDKPAGGSTPAELYGTWTGTWEGGGGPGGGFELTLGKGQGEATGASVSVTGEPTYEATIRTIAFDGKKMTAGYDFPPEESIEVRLTATFEGDTAKGTWTARTKADGGEVASGTWTVKKK